MKYLKMFLEQQSILEEQEKDRLNNSE